MGTSRYAQEKRKLLYRVVTGLGLTERLVIFSHGKESGPNGIKIQVLREVAHERGYRAISVDYRGCANADERVAKLKGVIAENPVEELVLVGSSMGGYVSAVVANDVEVSVLFLMAPAFYMLPTEYPVQRFAPRAQRILIVHGRGDELVPFENSERFAREVAGAELLLVEDNHRLSNSHGYLAERFAEFLREQ